MVEGLEMVASVSGGGGEDGEDGGEETGYGLVAATEGVAVEEEGREGRRRRGRYIMSNTSYIIIIAPYIYDTTYNVPRVPIVLRVYYHNYTYSNTYSTPITIIVLYTSGKGFWIDSPRGMRH